MSTLTELASGQITATETIKVELVQASETPAGVIITWPLMPTVIHPRRFGSAADLIARVFAGAVVRLAQIRRDNHL